MTRNIETLIFISSDKAGVGLENASKKSKSADDSVGVDDKGGQTQSSVSSKDDILGQDDKGQHTGVHGTVIEIDGEKAFYETRIKDVLKVEIRNAQGLPVRVDELRVRVLNDGQVLTDSLRVVRDDGISSEWEISGFDFAKAASDKSLVLEMNFLRSGVEHIARQALNTIRVD